jgi:hypothetical protein
MSVQAFSWVLECSRSTLGARLVLLAIANHADKDGRGSWASVGTLAREANLSERQVQRALRALEAAGEISKIGSAGVRADRKTNVYELPAVAAWSNRTSRPRGDSLSPRSGATGRRGSHPVGVTSGPHGVTSGPHGVTPVSPEPSLEPSIEPSFARARGATALDDDRSTTTDVVAPWILEGTTWHEYSKRLRGDRSAAAELEAHAAVALGDTHRGKRETA